MIVLGFIATWGIGYAIGRTGATPEPIPYDFRLSEIDDLKQEKRHSEKNWTTSSGLAAHIISRPSLVAEVAITALATSLALLMSKRWPTCSERSKIPPPNSSKI